MTPLISIIIPVGPAHTAHVQAALASCLWQTMPQWEAVVINDTGDALDIPDDPRIRLIDAPDRAGRRSSIARNAGFQAAAGVFVLPLDSDDYLLPTALSTFIRGHAAHDACYSYSWHYGMNRAGAWGLFRSPEYDREKLKTFNLHPITALIPRVAVLASGGCDEGAPGLEDWTLWLGLAKIGCCGRQVYGPTFVYRRDEGVNHIADVDGGLALMDAVRDRYKDKNGEITFMGCGCSDGGAKAAARQVAPLLSREVAMSKGLITLEYTGPGQGGQWFKVPSGRQYRAGRGPAVRYVQAPEDDAAHLQKLGFFVPVPPPAAFIPPPAGTVQPGTIAESATVPPDDGSLHDTLFEGALQRREEGWHVGEKRPTPDPQFEVPEVGKASAYPGRGKRRV